LHRKKYKIKCNGIDTLSLTDVDKKRKELYAKAELRPIRQKFEEQFKLPLHSANEPDPEDKEDVDLYMQGEFKLSIEVAMELGIDYFMKLNSFDYIRRQAIDDFWTIGRGGYYTSCDGQSISIKHVDGADLILPLAKSDDFKNAKYIFHIEWKTLGDIKREAGDTISEDDYKRIAASARSYKSSGSWGYIGNGEYYGNVTNDDYNNLDVPVMVGEFRSARMVNYDVKVNQRGRKYVSTQKTGGKTIEKKWEDTYKGSFIPAVDVIYNYEKKKNVIRDRFHGAYDLTGILGYSVFMPNSYDNYNVSAVARMIPFAKGMYLCQQRMQHIIAKSAPGGYMVNIDPLVGVKDFIKDVNDPVDVINLFLQNGYLLYRGSDNNGNPLPSPMSWVQGIDMTQLKAQMELYEFYRNELERSIGGSAVGMGAAPKERAAVGVQEMAQMAADNALGEVTYAEENITIRCATQVSKMIQLLQMNGSLKKYELAFSKEQQDVVKDMQQLPMRDFAIFVEYEPSDIEKAVLNQRLQEMVANKEILPEDEFWIRNVDDIKMAYLYMRKMRKKRIKEAQAMQEQNGQIQIQSAQAAEQSKQQTLETEYSLKLQYEAGLAAIKDQYAEKEHARQMRLVELQGNMKYKTAIDTAEVRADKTLQTSDLAK
jgi:hypothetical protein